MDVSLTFANVLASPLVFPHRQRRALLPTLTRPRRFGISCPTFTGSGVQFLQFCAIPRWYATGSEWKKDEEVMSELNARYQLASSDIVCEEFDGEMVILNLSSGHYFALNVSATVLMKGLLQGHAPRQLCSVDGASLAAETAIDLFRKLVAHELVAADTSQLPAPLDSSIREAVTCLLEEPTLEMHDDLADLVIADPIHDSDETAGWPVRKAA